MEENAHNPTIVKFKSKKVGNYFLIKYNNEQEREAYSDLVLRLAKNYELKDFHVEEKHAYQESRVLYNFHEVLKHGIFSYEKLERGFLRYFEN